MAISRSRVRIFPELINVATEIRLVVGIFFIIVKHISEVLAGARKVSGCSFIFDKIYLNYKITGE